MNLVKIGVNYFNLDLLASVQPGQILANPDHQPITPIDGYNLYFSGWTGGVPVFDPAEVKAIDEFIKHHVRPLSSTASGPVLSGTRPAAIADFRVR